MGNLSIRFLVITLGLYAVQHGAAMTQGHTVYSHLHLLHRIGLLEVVDLAIKASFRLYRLRFRVCMSELRATLKQCFNCIFSVTLRFKTVPKLTKLALTCPIVLSFYQHGRLGRKRRGKRGKKNRSSARASFFFHIYLYGFMMPLGSYRFLICFIRPIMVGLRL